MANQGRQRGDPQKGWSPLLSQAHPRPVKNTHAAIAVIENMIRADPRSPRRSSHKPGNARVSHPANNNECHHFVCLAATAPLAQEPIRGLSQHHAMPRGWPKPLRADSFHAFAPVLMPVRGRRIIRAIGDFSIHAVLRFPWPSCRDPGIAGCA